MHIKPQELEVPPDDPFKSDKLNRGEPIGILTNLIESVKGPCVLAVDAEWGHGKTTFLRFWMQYLRNKKFPVIQFNAWQTDYSDDPLLSLTSELMEGLEELDFNDELLKQLNKRRNELLKQSVMQNSIRILTKGIIDPAALVDERVQSYKRTKQSVTDFKAALAETADESINRFSKPLIIAIDELDRCRPPYAVELLEVTKHLFDLDNIIFILAINRSQLSRSIKVLYGNDFDSQEYLRRFFDIDFRLPTPDRTSFVDSLLSSTGFFGYLSDTKDPEARQQQYEVLMLLRTLFNISDISLRDIEQAIYRLGVLLDSLRGDRRSFLIGMITALIIRTFEPNLYYKFLSGEVTDVEVVDALFNDPGRKIIEKYSSNEELFHACSLLKATLILATITRNTQGMNPSSYDKQASRLLDRYESLISEYNTQNYEKIEAQSTPNHEHVAAKQVVNVVTQHTASARRSASNIIDHGFWISIKRLELISPDLGNSTT